MSKIEQMIVVFVVSLLLISYNRVCIVRLCSNIAHCAAIFSQKAPSPRCVPAIAE